MTAANRAALRRVKSGGITKAQAARHLRALTRRLDAARDLEAERREFMAAVFNADVLTVREIAEAIGGKSEWAVRKSIAKAS